MVWSIKSPLAQVQEKRKPERHSCQNSGQDRQPELAYGQAAALQPDKDEENHGRDDYIQPKECADARGKQLFEKQRQIQAMLRQPWNELKVRQEKAWDAQAEINVAYLHRVPSET